MERETGFEPATACLEGRGSTTELLPHRGEILEGLGGGVKGVHSLGGIVTRRFIQLWEGGVLVVLSGWLAMKDACWTLPPFLCFGCSDTPGQGRPARFCRCCGLWPLYTLDMGRDLQGHQVRA